MHPNHSLPIMKVSCWVKSGDTKPLVLPRTDEEMQAHLANNDQSKLGSAWGAGDIMYKDLDGKPGISSGDNTVDNPGDRKVIGNSTPALPIRNQFRS